MASSYSSNFFSSLIPPPHPNLHPIPGTTPLTPTAAVLPPLVYYLALLLLAPPPPTLVHHPLVILLRHGLAFAAAFLFFRLPLQYHVPQSIGLTYQLGLVGFYGGCRVMDAFFISPYIFGHVPRRVIYHHRQRDVSMPSGQAYESDGGTRASQVEASIIQSDEKVVHRRQLNGASQSDLPENTPRRLSILPSGVPVFPENTSSMASTTNTLARILTGPNPTPVFETATTDPGYPSTFRDRAAWAFDLELSMRGTGFTWTTADVRHTRKTWLPSVQDRVHSVLVHVLPVLLLSWYLISSTYTQHLRGLAENDQLFYTDAFDNLSLLNQLALTASLGAFLMAAFSLGHSVFAILLSPLAHYPSLASLAFFPPLYSTRIWDITSVRAFWSFGWHRLFARLFLVYGVWPGEWVERKLTGKPPGSRADLGKVIGGFLSSAVVHSSSVRGVLAGRIDFASGEFYFFVLNGLAVIVEAAIWEAVKSLRRRQLTKGSRAEGKGSGRAGEENNGGSPDRHENQRSALGFEQSYHDKNAVEADEVEGKDSELMRWYDPMIGRIWWITVLLLTGRNFARGWVRSGLVREMAFM